MDPDSLGTKGYVKIVLGKTKEEILEGVSLLSIQREQN